MIIGTGTVNIYGGQLRSDKQRKAILTMDEQEFVAKYGECDADGTPRFSDIHAFGHNPLELSIKDTIKLNGIDGLLFEFEQYSEKFWGDLGDNICDKIGL